VLFFFYRFKNQKCHASQSHKVIQRITDNCASKIPFNLCFKGSRRKAGEKKETKSSRATLSSAFLLTWENPISKLKIPISFCNCLHTEAVLSAKTSLKKKKTEGGRERGKLYAEMARKQRRCLMNLAQALQ